MTYKTNTPNYNNNSKVVNFQSFCSDCEENKLKAIKRSTKRNSPDEHQVIGNTKYKFNNVTRKLDDISPEIVDDSLEALDDIKESIINESADFDLIQNMKQTSAYSELRDNLRVLLDEFQSKMSDECGFDEGITDHSVSMSLLLSDAIEEAGY
jgi:hypothetical protein